MPTYKVLPASKTFGRRAPGTLLELTVEEYAGLSHLLELVPDELVQPVTPETPVAPAEQAQASASGKTGTDTRRRRRKAVQAQE